MTNDAERERRRHRLPFVLAGAAALVAVAMVVPRLSDSTHRRPPTTSTTTLDGIAVRPDGTDAGSPVFDSPAGTRFRVRITDARGDPVVGAPVTFAVGEVRAANHRSANLRSGEPSRAVFASVRRGTAAGAFAPCPRGNPTPQQCRVLTDDDGVATSSLFVPTSARGVYTLTVRAVVDGRTLTLTFTVTLPEPGPPAAPSTTVAPRGAAAIVTPATPTPAPPTSTIPSGTFTISGDVTVPVLPGGAYPLDLVVTNPRNLPITIPAGGVTVVISTGQAGCPAVGNFAITHGLLEPVTIPANATRSLSALGVPIGHWPVFSMIETNTDQDACRGVTVVLSYSALATG